MFFCVLLALHFTHLMLLQSSYSTLVDETTESVRFRLVFFALTAELFVLLFINVAFLTFGLCCILLCVTWARTPTACSAAPQQ
jgi:hypothetical protein